MKTFPFKYHKTSDYLDYFNPKDWFNFLLEELNPVYSISKTRAKIISIHLESKETKTLVLRVNKKVFRFQPGQYIPVTVEINGKRVTRYYSISSMPSEKNLRITVKRQKQGLVSNFVHENLQLGDFVELGEAQGSFVLPKTLPGKFLFVAGGSGITPVYSILKTLQNQNYIGSVKLLYFSRTKEEIIFYSELNSLSKKFPSLAVEFILTDEDSMGFKTGFFSREMLLELVPDFSDRLTYLCGPGSLQESVKSIIPKEKLISENFQPFLKNSIKKDSKQVEVTLTKSHRTILLNGEKNLLEELEDNGVFPQSGCRMGICHTCACTKKSGVVTNLQEGSESESGEETIQLCLSRAEENLELDI